MVQEERACHAPCKRTQLFTPNCRSHQVATRGSRDPPQRIKMLPGHASFPSPPQKTLIRHRSHHPARARPRAGDAPAARDKPSGAPQPPGGCVAGPGGRGALTAGAVRRRMLSPSESRLTRRRRGARRAPALAAEAAEPAAVMETDAAARDGSEGPGGLRLPFQQRRDRGHSPSSSGLVSGQSEPSELKDSEEILRRDMVPRGAGAQRSAAGSRGGQQRRAAGRRGRPPRMAAGCPRLGGLRGRGRGRGRLSPAPSSALGRGQRGCGAGRL